MVKYILTIFRIVSANPNYQILTKSADIEHAYCLSYTARVAKLADAHDSGSCVREDMGVQVPPRAPCTALIHKHCVKCRLLETLPDKLSDLTATCITPLDHQEVNHIPVWINPALSAP